MTGSALAGDRAAARHVKLTLQLPAGLRLRRGRTIGCMGAAVQSDGSHRGHHASRGNAAKAPRRLEHNDHCAARLVPCDIR